MTAQEYGFDEVEMGLGDWHSEDSAETYRCPSCGCVWHAKEWHWYGYGPADRDDPMDDGDVTCGECDAPLDEADIVRGYGCGDCGHAVAEAGSDYCTGCNAAHEAAEQAEPMHHHVWQSADEWQRMVREITLEQAGAR